MGPLYTALAKAQGELQNPAKNKANPHFKSRYADLGQVLETVLPVFSKHGLAVTQMVISADNRAVTVRTLLTHSSGLCLGSDATAVPERMTPQGLGSSITYLRRYMLASIAGVAQVDDDGQEASGTPPSTRKAPTARKPSKAPSRAREKAPEKAPAKAPAAEAKASSVDSRRAAAMKTYHAMAARVYPHQWEVLGFQMQPSAVELEKMSHKVFGELFAGVREISQRNQEDQMEGTPE